MADNVNKLNFNFSIEGGAPVPYVLANEDKTFLIFFIRDDRTLEEKIARFNFKHCQQLRFGSPNEDLLSSHYLYKQGLESYSIFEVRDSSWIDELKTTLYSNSRLNVLEGYKHLVFCFHDSTFECICKEYQVDILDLSMPEIIDDTVVKLK